MRDECLADENNKFFLKQLFAKELFNLLQSHIRIDGKSFKKSWEKNIVYSHLSEFFGNRNLNLF